MNTQKLFCCFLINILLTSLVCNAQTDSSEIYVRSWSTENIRERKFNIELNSTQTQHTEYLNRWAGAGYRFDFVRVPAGIEDYKLEHWVVTLKQVLSKENSKKEELGCNLLKYEGCGIQHYFPQEDLVGYLYPLEIAQTPAEKYLLPNYYPMSAKRIIKVKSFYIIIKVNNYKMNETDRKKLDSLNITIEVKNWLNKPD